MFSRQDLIKLIIPLIIEQALAVTVGLVDSMMVSSVGEAAVSGVSLVDSINTLIIGLFAALATGGAVVSAQLLGHKDEKSACAAGEQLMITIVALALLVMAAALLFGNEVLILLYGGVDPDVMAFSRTYLFYSAMSFPFIAIYNASAALFRSMGNSKVSMFVSLLMNILHIILNVILIFGLELGVAGAAISTLFSRFFAAFLLTILLMNKKYVIHFSIRSFLRVDISMIKRILRIGVPNGLENSMFQIGKILVQGIVAGLGTASITANSIAGTIGGFGVLPGSAMSLALITVVGRCIGARDYDGVKYYTHKLMKFTYIIMVVINMTLLLALPLIIRIYNLSDVTSEMTNQLMTYHCVLAMLIWPMSFTLPSALRAANDVKFTMWISMFSMWVWRILFSYLLAITFDLGVFGVWIAMTIDWLFRSVCFALRFKKGKYKEISAL